MKEIPPCQNPKVPAARVPFNHSVDLQTRFNDYDIFRHLNNTVYLAFLDLGKVRYFTEALGFKVDVDQTSAVIVNINVSFCSPAYMGEPLRVLTACSGVSKHSFTIDQRIVNPDTGDVKCYATTVMACFDIATATGAEVPAEWIKSVADFENWAEIPTFAHESKNKQ